MDITYIGHSCFRLKGREAAIITDPFPPSYGYSMGRANASIVTVSHDHPNHSYLQGVAGLPKIVSGPGEYEISNILIYGVQTYHARVQRSKRNTEHASDDEDRPVRNTAYVMDFDDLRVCHLGDLGHELTEDQIEALGSINVLLVPVGGGATIDADRATLVVSKLEPNVVIPMHYRTEGTNTRELEPVDRFIREMGTKSFTPQPKLTVSKSSLPSEPQVVVLENKKA